VARKVFISFHYDPDNWRVQQVLNIGAIEGEKTCSANEWEKIWRGGEAAVKSWIEKQLEGKSCLVVLVGAETSRRPLVIYEIERAWNTGKGVVAVRIHGLLDRHQEQSSAGGNPLAELHFISQPSKLLSSVAKLYDPPYSTSQYVYAHITDNLDRWIEEAIEIRKNYQ